MAAPVKPVIPNPFGKLPNPWAKLPKLPIVLKAPPVEVKPKPEETKKVYPKIELVPKVVPPKITLTALIRFIVYEGITYKVLDISPAAGLSAKYGSIPAGLPGSTLMKAEKVVVDRTNHDLIHALYFGSTLAGAPNRYYFILHYTHKIYKITEEVKDNKKKKVVMEVSSSSFSITSSPYFPDTRTFMGIDPGYYVPTGGSGIVDFIGIDGKGYLALSYVTHTYNTYWSGHTLVVADTVSASIRVGEFGRPGTTVMSSSRNEEVPPYTEVYPVVLSMLDKDVFIASVKGRPGSLRVFGDGIAGHTIDDFEYSKGQWSGWYWYNTYCYVSRIKEGYNLLRSSDPKNLQKKESANKLPIRSGSIHKVFAKIKVFDIYDKKKFTYKIEEFKSYILFPHESKFSYKALGAGGSYNPWGLVIEKEYKGAFYVIPRETITKVEKKDNPDGNRSISLKVILGYYDEKAMLYTTLSEDLLLPVSLPNMGVQGGVYSMVVVPYYRIDDPNEKKKK